MHRVGLSAIGWGAFVLLVASCSDNAGDTNVAPGMNTPTTGGVGAGGMAGAGATAGAGGSVTAGSGQGGSLAGAGAGGATGGATMTGGSGPAGAAGAGNGSGGQAAGGSAGMTGGASGTSGAAGATSGAGGVAAGASGAGPGGMGGMGGGTPTDCTFTVDHTRGMIQTVEVVTFSTTLAGLTSASIEFGRTGSALDMVAPVDLEEPEYRTLLLGMKQSEDYTFRIVARAGDQVCTSEEYTLTTGTLQGAPSVTRTVMNEAAVDRGFIVTSSGITGTGMNFYAFIIDGDGDVVWATQAPQQCSRARMSYDGKHMYMMSLNVQNLSMNGQVRRIAMDGSGSETLSGLNGAHHDLTVTPDNGLATIVWSGQCSAIVERTEGGQLNTIVPNVDATLYETVNDCHTNAINYNAHDDTYTLSDRNPNLFVKLTRDGEIVWQLGGNNPKQGAMTFTGLDTWQVNHGHHWLPDGTFVFFSNGTMGGSNGPKVYAYTLNEDSGTATRTLLYQPTGIQAPVLSDAQRLPNGNYMATYSQGGQIHEISPQGTLVQRFQTNGLGYSEFRKSMYGPPLR